MTRILTIILVFIMCSIAGLHLYWGLGGFWPGFDNDSLVGMVVGLPAGTPMPPLWACIFVALCLTIASIAVSIIAFSTREQIPKPASLLVAIIFWVSAFVFVARGAAGYSELFDTMKATRFYDLNRMIYSPLYLALGAGLIMLWLSRPIPTPNPTLR